MSDDPEDRDGTEQVTEQAGQVGAWSEPAAGPRWSEIASEADATAVAPGIMDAGLSAAAPGESQPATEAGRSRRPSSLRSGSPAPTEVPARGVASPASAGRTPIDAPQRESESDNPVSEAARAGRSGQMSKAAGSLLEKAPVGKLQALVKERPEAGLGLAFLGGLVIATVLRRLAR